MISAGALTTAIGAAANSAGSEAGRQAWESLLSLWRRIRGPQAIDAVHPEDSEQVRTLTTEAIEECRRNTAFAADLVQWAQQFGFTVQYDRSSTHNTLSEGAHVEGPVIQGRDFSGPINFGN